MQIIFNILLICLLLLASYTDLKWRVIPNYIPLIILAIGLYSGYINQSYIFGLMGLGIASLLFIPYLLKQTGGGDVKLFLALGYYLGIGIILLLFIVTILLGLFYILKGARKANVPLAPFILVGYLIIGGAVVAKVF